MQALKAKLEADGQSRALIVPVGGSDATGVWGYIEAFEELLSQGLAQDFDEVAVACGSGGTLGGLAVANFLSGSPVRITGFAVCDDAAYFHGHINEMLAALGLQDRARSEDLVTIIDDYKGLGYGRSRPEELEFVREVAATTGVILDPVYTGKAAYGLSHCLATDHRTLFIHTGGTFGVFGSLLTASPAKILLFDAKQDAEDS